MVQYVSGTNCGHHGQNGQRHAQRHAQRQLWYKKPLILFTRETPYHIFIFPAGRARAARARAAKVCEANQQCHFKSSRCGMKCYARIPAAEQFPWNLRCLTAPSMPHREPIKWNLWYAYNHAGGFLYYSSICKENSQDSKNLFTGMFWERLTTEFDFGLARHWQKSCL